MADAHELGLTARAQGFKEASKDLDDLTVSATKAEDAADKLTAATKKVKPAVEATGKAVKETGKEAEAAGRKIDGSGRAAETAGRKAKVALTPIKGLGDAVNFAGWGAKKAIPPVEQFGDETEKAGRKASGAAGGLRQASLQISQIAQQATAGTPVMQAFAIQLPDLMLGFGTVGVLAGAAAGPILSVVTAMITGGDEAKSYGDKLSDLAAAHDSYTEAAARSNASLITLAAGYGALANEVERNLNLQTALAAAGVNAARDSAVTDLTGRFNSRRGEQANANGTPIEELRQSNVTAMMLRPGRASDQDRLTLQFIKELKDEFDLTTAGALDLGQAIQELAKAKTLEEQAAGAVALEQAMVDVAGGADKAVKKFGDFLADTTALGSTLREQLGGGEIEDVLDRYVERSGTLAQLAQDRKIAEEALTRALEAQSGLTDESSLAQMEAATQAVETARQAIDAIDEQAQSATEAEERLEDMRATVLMLENAMARVDFDGEGELRARVNELKDQIKRAEKNVDDLNDADVSKLETGMRGVAALAETFMRHIQGGVEAMGRGADVAAGYGQYYRSRNAAPDSRVSGVDVSSAAELLKAFEGFRTTAYDDGKTDRNGNRVGAPVYRAGYGSDTIQLADGTISKITQGMTVTQEDANRDLARRIGEFQQGVIDEIGVTAWASFNEQQRAAVTSVAYNYGSVGAGGAGIADELRSGDTHRIVKAIEGLAGHNGGINSSRRLTEAQIFAGGGSIGAAGGISDRFDQAAERDMEKAAREAEAAAREVEQLQNRYDSLSGSLSETVAVENKHADALKLISEAQAAGLITAAQADAQRAQAAVQREEGMAKIAEAAKEEMRAYEALLASLDPLTAASMQYAAALETINEALAAGAITEAQASEARQLAQADMDKTIAKLDETREASRRGAEALSSMFMGILDGSMSGQEALASLLMQLAQVQMMRAMIGMSNMGGPIGGMVSALGSGLTMPSADGGGWTGNGARAGGMDGKGGFPVMVHPREQIIDTTKPGQHGGAGGVSAVDVRVGVDKSGNLQAFVEQVSSGVSRQALSAYDRGMSGRVKQIQNDPRAR